MNISSAQQDYSITSSDTITLTAGSGYSADVITVDLSNIPNTSTGYTIGGGGAGVTMATYTGAGFGGGAGTISISNGGIQSINIGPLTSADIANAYPQDWINRFPEWARIQKMCETYPGLKIAFEKFKTTYNLVKDDFDAPPDKRIKP